MTNIRDLIPPTRRFGEDRRPRDDSRESDYNSGWNDCISEMHARALEARKQDPDKRDV